MREDACAIGRGTYTKKKRLPKAGDWAGEDGRAKGGVDTAIIREYDNNVILLNDHFHHFSYSLVEDTCAIGRGTYIKKKSDLQRQLLWHVRTAVPREGVDAPMIRVY